MDKNVATIRTAVHGTWVSTLVIVFNRVFGWSLTLDDLLPFLPFVPFILAILYRVALVVSEKFPALGFILFGSKKQPKYSEFDSTRAMALLEMVADNFSTARTVLFQDSVAELKSKMNGS